MSSQKFNKHMSGACTMQGYPNRAYTTEKWGKNMQVCYLAAT